MRKSLLVLAILFVVFAPAAAIAAPSSCTTVQDAVLTTTDGYPIAPGYDVWGYNYGAHRFGGDYCDAYHNANWCQPYVGTNLAMQWNDAWIASSDCNNDGALDRHRDYPTYLGSGAWLTNHMSGDYVQDGEACHWVYFVKIVAAPSLATASGGFWYDEDGDLIGPIIWGEFAVVQEVSNDPCAGLHGLAMKGVRPGVGNWEDPD